MASPKDVYLLLCLCAFFASGTFAQSEPTEAELQQQEQLVLETREHILAGNFFALNQILANVSNTTTVARGFRYEPEEAALFTRVTPNRAGDADVVSLRSFARSLLSGEADADILAEVYTAVLFIQGPEYAPDPATTFKNVFESFTNVTAMQLILDADPTEVDEEDDDEDATGLRRRLLVAKGKPADTPLCNSCFEKSFCKKNAPWC